MRGGGGCMWGGGSLWPITLGGHLPVFVYNIWECGILFRPPSHLLIQLSLYKWHAGNIYHQSLTITKINTAQRYLSLDSV